MKIIHLEGEEDDIIWKLCNILLMKIQESIHLLIILIHDGGHEEGVRRALTRLINNYARKTNMLKEKMKHYLEMM